MLCVLNVLNTSLKLCYVLCSDTEQSQTTVTDGHGGGDVPGSSTAENENPDVHVIGTETSSTHTPELLVLLTYLITHEC